MGNDILPGTYRFTVLKNFEIQLHLLSGEICGNQYLLVEIYSRCCFGYIGGIIYSEFQGNKSGYC
jgi:hypothetical protein